MGEFDGDGTTCAGVGDDSGWMMGDTSEFHGDGCAAVNSGWMMGDASEFRRDGCAAVDSGWMMGDASEFRRDGCAAVDSSWMMGDASEFRRNGCAAVEAAAWGAGLCDFSAQSDARWRRSSCAIMPN